MSLVSVCIPTYNGSRTLRRCLNSVLAQDADVEVVIGDDHSSDDTREIARSFQDPRVRMKEFPERLGMTRNWNRTIALARGDYVALVGQDDELEPFWARKLGGLLERHPEADLAFGRRRFCFEDEESRATVGDFFENRYPEMLAPFYEHVGEVIPPAQMLEEALRFSFEINLIGEPTFVLFRRDHPAVARGFDENMAQMVDWEFYTRFFRDRPLLHCPEILGTYHIHARASSIDNAPLSKHYREYGYFLDLIRERFASLLAEDQAKMLEARHVEVRGLQVEWEQKEQEKGS